MPLDDEWVLPQRSFTDASEALHCIVEERISASGTERSQFLEPTLEHLHDPSTISGIGEASERIVRAIRDREAIVIYGDYDVDGVTSIVLLSRVIALLGGQVSHVVPHRLFDGYGLKTEVLDRVLVERSVRLVITVDCGITSVEPVSRALEQGIDVIITDHHLPPELLPEAVAVLNPKKPGCTYPYKELAGVGVAFKLCCSLLTLSGRKLDITSLLRIAALGTIADVAPLDGENRTIARIGLQSMTGVRNRGLRALLADLGLLGKPLRASDVGFRIGPRINAAGRLASADTAIQLFNAESDEEARSLVVELNRLNSERQSVERGVLAEADRIIAGLEVIPNVLLLAGEGWHKGVLGLCAGRIAQKLHRPTVVMTLGDTDCTASARSAGGFDLHNFLEGLREHFTHFGGHEFACGLSLKRSAFPAFRSALEQHAAQLPVEQFVRRVSADATVSFRGIESLFLQAHDALEPFGAANATPRFHTEAVRVSGLREFSPDCYNLTLRDAGGHELNATVWRPAGVLREMISRDGTPFDLVYSITPDRYGRHGIRVDIADVRRSRAERTAPPTG